LSWSTCYLIGILDLVSTGKLKNYRLFFHYNQSLTEQVTKTCKQTGPLIMI